MELQKLETDAKGALIKSASVSPDGCGSTSYQSYDGHPQHPSGDGDNVTCMEHTERGCQNRSNNQTMSESPLTNFDETEKGETLSDFQGVMLLIPYYISMGFLGLPHIVKVVGLWVGVGGLLLYGFLNEACIMLLVDSTQCLTERTGERFGDIVRVAEMSMKLGPPWLRPHAGKYKFMVEFVLLFNNFLCLGQMLSLMTLFSKDLLEEVLEINPQLLLIIISALSIPVYLARDMKSLTILSSIANIVLLGIAAISFQYICRDLPDVGTRPAARSVDYLTFTTFGNGIMFTVDGIGVILPVRSRMRATKHFDGWTGVLGVTMMFVTCFHAACGFYGYLKFGEQTHVMYLLDLPVDNWLYKSLKILFVLTIYCSIGVIVFVPVDVSWRRIKDRLNSELIRNYGEYVFRFVFLIAVCIFTLLIPEVQWLMSLTGCVWAFFGVLVVPSTAKILLLYDDIKPDTWTGKLKRNTTMIACYSLLIFGVYSSVSGVLVTLYMISMNIVV